MVRNLVSFIALLLNKLTSIKRRITLFAPLSQHTPILTPEPYMDVSPEGEMSLPTKFPCPGREYKFTFPLLLDPGRKINVLFDIDGIPKSFVYDRDGKLVAQAIDMRTREQFMGMLAQAGVH